MCQSENPDPPMHGALGFNIVLMSVSEPLLESIFWLALGCALGWQDKKCFVRINESADSW
jgi:hypothetical protein